MGKESSVSNNVATFMKTKGAICSFSLGKPDEPNEGTSIRKLQAATTELKLQHGVLSERN